MLRTISGPVLALIGLFVLLFGTAGWLYKDWLLPKKTPTNDKEWEIPNKLAPNVALQDKDKNVVLEEEQRKFIWDVEHEVLVVNGFWFKDLSKALAKGDEQALSSFLAANFSGHALNKPTETAMKNDFAEVVRHEDSGEPARALTSSQFVAQLMEYRRIFAKEPKVAIKAKNLCPVVRQEYEGEWEGTALFRLCGETEGGGPAEVLGALTYRIAHPLKEHDQKGWLFAAGLTQSQVSKGKHYLLKDVTLERGVDSTQFYDDWKSSNKNPFTGGVYLCDFNRDGIPDMLVTDTVNTIALFKGLPDGRMVDVTAEMGLPTAPSFFHKSPYVSMASTWIDIDGDGWEDLILLGHVYRNDKGKGFVDYTAKTNLRMPPAANNIAVADFDKDGKVDLYITRPGIAKAASWLDGHSGQGEGNQLWRNLGNWQFANVTESAKAAGGNRSTFSAVWFDANNDGWPDLYVPNEFGNGVLLLNQKNGTFKEQALAPGANDFGTMGISCGDINNDGHIDLFMANMFSKAGTRIIGNLKPGTYSDEIMAKFKRMVAGNQLYLNRGDLKFDPLGKELAVHDVGWAHGPNLIDLDNDGFLDIFCTTGFVSVNRNEPDG